MQDNNNIGVDGVMGVRTGSWARTSKILAHVEPVLSLEIISRSADIKYINAT
jgi:hypothetical protein